MARRQVSIFINGKQVANQIKTIKGEARTLRRALNDMVIGSDDYNKTTAELSRVNKIIAEHRQKLKPIKKDLEGNTKAAGAYTQVFSKITGGLGTIAGAAGIAFTVDQIIDYGTELFKLGGKMKALGKKAKTVLGDELARVTNLANENANAMGLTAGEYINATTAAADLLIPMKFTRKEAADISTNLVDLSGALAEWTGGQIESTEVSNILTKALLGEREELKQLGISISEADISRRLADKGMKKLTGTALEQAKALITLELITEKSTDAQTAFANNADLSIRKQAELTARIKDINASLATAFLPLFEKSLKVVGKVTDVIAEMAGANQKASESVENLRQEFNSEIETLRRGNLSSENRKILIEEINNKYKDYLPNLITEKTSIDEIAKAQEKANEKFLERITLLAAEELIVESQNKLIEAKKQELELQKKISEEEFKLQKERKKEEGFKGFTIFSVEDDSRDPAFALDLLKVKFQENQEEILNFREDLLQAQKAAKELGIELSSVFDNTTGDDDGSGPTSPTLPNGSDQENALQKQLEELEKITEEYRKRAELARLEEDDRRLQEIKNRYEKEITTAKELEEKKVEGATELRKQLETQLEQELQTLRDEFRLRDQEQQLEDAKKLGEILTQQIEQRKDAEMQVNKFLLSDRELELQSLEAHFEQLLELARLYGLNVQAVTDEYRRKKKEINDKYDKEDLAAQKAKQQAELNAVAQGFREVATLTQSFADLFAAAGEKGANAAKTFSLITLLAKSGEAIASVVAAGASLTFPANLAAIASGVATVLTNIAQARSLLNEADSVPQRNLGGYFDVLGQDDGKQYHAQYIGKRKTGMLPSKPVVLASEGGPEYFVANEDLKNPLVVDYVNAIENIRRSRLGIPQRQMGGFFESGTSPMRRNTSSGSSTLPALTRQDIDMIIGLLIQIREVSASSVAVVPDRTIEKIEERKRTLEDIKGDTL